MDSMLNLTLHNPTDFELSVTGCEVTPGWLCQSRSIDGRTRDITLSVLRPKRGYWSVGSKKGLNVLELQGTGHFLALAWYLPAKIVFSGVPKVTLGIYRFDPQPGPGLLLELLDEIGPNFERYLCPKSHSVFVMVSSQFLTFSGTIHVTKRTILGSLQVSFHKPFVPNVVCRVYLLLTTPKVEDSGRDVLQTDEFGNSWRVICDFNSQSVVVCGAKICSISGDISNGTHMTTMSDLKMMLGSSVQAYSMFRMGTITTSPCELSHLTNRLVPIVNLFQVEYQHLWLLDFWDHFHLDHKVILNIRSSDLVQIFKIKSQSPLKHWLCGSFAIVEEVEILSENAKEIGS